MRQRGCQIIGRDTLAFVVLMTFLSLDCSYNVLYSVIENDTCGIITQKQAVDYQSSTVSSSHGLSGRFHRTFTEVQFTPLFVLWSVLALSREFLCYLFMTGNAHHKRLVSTYLRWELGLVEWKRTLSRSHTDLQIDTHALAQQSKGRNTNQTHIQAGSRGTLTETVAPGPCTRVGACGGQSVTLWRRVSGGVWPTRSARSPLVFCRDNPQLIWEDIPPDLHT